jgi:acyl transferase domain-containing protein/NADP-dependent 3-hydroxy acid dehydrogenase YdfG/acyl carrier protein
MEDISFNIAIIGMDCRIPGAGSTEEFWSNLVNGVESITDFTKEELLESGESLKDINNHRYVPRRGIINGVDKFDASFFGFTPREAELLDPQHRIFLETCWHTLEDGGYAKQDENVKVGVFGGSGTAWYLNDVYSNTKIRKVADSTSIVTGSDKDYLTTRVSYKLNLTGPSLDIQSACSTSMAAIILGIQSLQNFQSDLILAGGVSVQYPEKRGYLFAPGSLESKDGHCRPFDKDASGTAFSRGCGVILLKRLEDAIEDKDNIYAVIKSGAINNDGNKKAGFTAPSIEGQKEVIVEAIETAEVSVKQISMVEAHGTATPVGDPIEVSSLTEAFHEYTSDNGFCALGSVKSNIGHSDAASGVLSVIKTALAIKNGTIPASINYNEPNPKIDFEKTPFFVNTNSREWPNKDERIALVNSFGVGGTNACMILGNNTLEKSTENTKNKHNFYLLPVSAKSQKVIDVHKKEIGDFILKNPGINISNLSFTALQGRKHFNYRASIAFKNTNDLLQKIKENKWKSNKLKQEDRKLAFMFPGQGNQYIGMGKELYESYDVFRKSVDDCANAIHENLGIDILKTIFASQDDEKAKKLINQTYITQPALFTISYATAKLLMSWGYKAEVLMGHSVGEYVAATLAGVFSLSDALKAVSIRGKLIQELPGGAMTAVLMSEEDVLPLLGNQCTIGALNNPGLSVISGPYNEIETLEKKLSELKIFNKRIPTSHAFHSPMMDAMLDKFTRTIENIELNIPKIPVLSTVTGSFLSNEEATSVEYWVQHVRKTVRFSDAVQLMIETTPSVFLEVGPGQSLESAVKRHFKQEVEHSVCGTMHLTNGEQSESEHLISSLGMLWNFGIDANYKLFFNEDKPSRIPIPLYAFDRKKYIVEKPSSKEQIEEDEEVKNLDLSQWAYVQNMKKTLSSKILLQQYKNKITQENNENTKEEQLLIFGDDNEITNTIVKLTNNKHTVKVLRGACFEKLNTNEYKVNPSKREDYKSVFSNLRDEGIIVNRIIHLWNISEGKETDEQSNELNAFYSPLYLEQALIEHSDTSEINILFVCDGLLNIGNENIISPLKSLLVGPVRTIRKESKYISARLVDIESSKLNYNTIGKMLLDEVRILNDDLVIALRKNGRWTEFFEKIELPKLTHLTKSFKDNGVYLITGGTGGMGLEFAKYAAKSEGCKLILTYQTTMPQRQQWNEYIEQNDGDFMSEKLKTIIELENSGANISLVQLDIANEQQVADLAKFIKEKWERLDGIIHAAGKAGGGIIALKTPEMANEVIYPKTKGTLLLDKYFGKFKSDFTAYFSSITAVVPEPSRIDYMGANSFLDYYAKYRNQNNSSRSISINWGSWSKVGMAARWKEIRETQNRKLYENKEYNKAGLHNEKLDNGKEIYRVGIDNTNNWVYKEHLVGKQETLVGTFIIDCFNKIAEIKYPNKKHSISDLYFTRPVFIKKHFAPLLRLNVTTEQNGYRIQFLSLESSDKNAHWETAATCFISDNASPCANIDDIKDLWNGFTKDNNNPLMFQEVIKDGKELLKYSKRWMNVVERYRQNNTYIVHQTLPSNYIHDLNHFVLHPAVLDSLFANIFSNRSSDLYLPFSYKKLSIYGNFTKNMYAIVELLDVIENNPDTVSFNAIVYSAEGKAILKINNYTFMNMAKKQLNNTNVEEIDAQEDKDNILPQEGIDIFERVMNYGIDGNIILSPYNILKDIETAFVDKENSTEEIEEATTYERPDLSSEYVEPSNEIEETIVKIWGQILGIGKIGINDHFNELGGNSLLIVQSLSNISQAFEMEIPVSAFKDNETVKSLAEYIMSVLIEDIDDTELDELLNEL